MFNDRQFENRVKDLENEVYELKMAIAKMAYVPYNQIYGIENCFDPLYAKKLFTMKHVYFILQRICRKNNLEIKFSPAEEKEYEFFVEDNDREICALKKNHT